MKIKFLANLKRFTFLNFFIKEIYKKNEKNFIKLKKLNVVHAHEFPGSPRKSYVPHTFLGFSALEQNDENVQMTILH